MQKEFRAVLFTVACSAGLSSPIAYAADGIITFTGEVKDQTCTISTENKNKAITLPTVGTTALNQPGATAGLTPVTLTFTDCPVGTIGTYFEGGAFADSNTGNLKNSTESGYASNVQIRLLKNDFSVITIGGSNNPIGSITTTADKKDAELSFFAQYYATGLATAGNVSSSVQYTITYQ